MHTAKMLFLLLIVFLLFTACSAYGTQGTTVLGVDENIVMPCENSKRILSNKEIVNAMESYIKVSDPQANIYDLISTIYSDEELAELKEFNGTLDELSGRYPVECLRKSETGYVAIYSGESSILEIFFNNDLFKENVLLSSPALSKDDFLKVKIGQTLEDMQELDPGGYFLFLYTGIALPHESYHYTTDGHFVIIKYNDLNKIISIDISLI